MAEGIRGTKERGESKPFDFTEITKIWKKSYLEGVELTIKGQEEAEKAFKSGVSEGFSVPREWLGLSQQWIRAWDEIAGISTGIPNPWRTWTKQCTEAYCGGVGPFFKSAEETFETGYSFYETKVSAPSRKYVREFSNRYVDKGWSG